MKIATKTLASLMLIVMLSLSAANFASAAPQSNLAQNNQRKLARVYKRHDRKFELRASVLGLSADELKDQLKNKSFATIIHQRGFKTEQAYNVALAGKLKDELRKRGWTDQKIAKLVQKKQERIGVQMPT